MIIPIGHEQDTVRRLPWITFGIMGICVLALGLTTVYNTDSGPAEAAFDEAVEYFLSHPYLEMNEEFQRTVLPGVSAEEGDEFLRFAVMQNPPPRDDDVRRSEQERFDSLCSTALDHLERIPIRRFGLIPAEQNLFSWITHMFMHGGWLHLLGNLLILYLAGPFIEDVYGRLMYPAFYLAAGIFASLAYVFKVPDSTIPLVGASGAIAGVMGAFLVRYGRTSIRFFYIFGFVFRGTFDAPAWLMLPMWFCEQLVMAKLTEGIEGGGVAYWAHVGGFAFGVGAALAVKHFQVEERYIQPRIAAAISTTVVNNPVVEQALQARGAGDEEGAFDLLRNEVRKNPGNRDAALALWTIGEEQGRIALVAPAMIALIRDEVRSGNHDIAVDHWRELLSKAPGSCPDPGLTVRIAQILLGLGRLKEAAEALRLAMLSGGGKMPASVALKIAASARSIDPRISRGAVELALAHPDLVPMEHERAVEILASFENN